MIYLILYALAQSCVFIGVAIERNSALGGIASFMSALYFMTLVIEKTQGA